MTPVKIFGVLCALVGASTLERRVAEDAEEGSELSSAETASLVEDLVAVLTASEKDQKATGKKAAADDRAKSKKEFPELTGFDPESAHIASEVEQDAAEHAQTERRRDQEFDAVATSTEEMASQNQQLQNEIASAGLPPVESADQIEKEVAAHYRALTAPRPFLAQAQQDLVALQHMHAAPEPGLDAASRESEKEIAAFETRKPDPVDTTWVDHTEEDIAANRKKVHDVAARIKAEFFGTQIEQPPESLVQTQALGPGASLIQHSIAAGAAATVGDQDASNARAMDVLQSDSAHLEEDFEKSFQKGMAEGFAAEKKQTQQEQEKSQLERDAETVQRTEEQAKQMQRVNAVQQLEKQSEASLRAVPDTE